MLRKINSSKITLMLLMIITVVSIHQSTAEKRNRLIIDLTKDKKIIIFEEVIKKRKRDLLMI